MTKVPDSEKLKRLRLPCGFVGYYINKAEAVLIGAIKLTFRTLGAVIPLKKRHEPGAAASTLVNGRLWIDASTDWETR